MLRLLNFISGAVCLSIAILLTLELGLNFGERPIATYHLFHQFYKLYFILDVVFRVILTRKSKTGLSIYPTDIFVIGLFSFGLTGMFTDLILNQLSLTMIMLGRLGHINLLIKWLKFKPTQTLVLGFAFAVFVGALLLSLPISSASGSLSFVDALFTATSAICVTGLNTLDVSQDFTRFGQTILLILIQVGGLGILSFSVLLAMFLNKSVSHKESMEIQESFAASNMNETFQVIRHIFKITLLVEVIGAAVLFMFWRSQYASLSEALFYSVFHSVSAFCNAGFSLFSEGMLGFASNTPILLSISGLIIIGGIGFPVIFNILKNRDSKMNFIKVQTRLAIRVTLWLLSLGTLGFFLLEYGNTLANFALKDKVLLSFFHSVSSRTAGFNAVEIGLLNPATLVLIMGLMFIGASPGSTGGGIKTTTFGVLTLAFWQTLRSHQRLIWSGRAISIHNVLKALTIVMVSVIIIILFLFLLLLSEEKSFLTIVFETISAFGTVGLSMGITPELSKLSKGIIMVLMLVGRVGPLTIAFALSARKQEPNVSYPEENILIT